MADEDTGRRAGFPAIHDRWKRGELTQRQGATLLGISDRTFRRWRARYRSGGLDGLLERKPRPHNAASPDEVRALDTLYREHYLGWSVQHSHQVYRLDHGGTRSYHWARGRLQAAGLIKPCHVNGRGNGGGQAEGVAAKPRPRQPSAGMLLHEVGRGHEWVPGHRWDLVLLIDDATNRVCAGVFSPDPHFWPRLQCVRETVLRMGLFGTLATGRSGDYWYSGLGSRQRSRVRRQFARVMAGLGIEYADGTLAVYQGMDQLVRYDGNGRVTGADE